MSDEALISIAEHDGLGDPLHERRRSRRSGRDPGDGALPVRATLDGVSFVGRVPIVAPNYLIEGTLPKGGVVFLGGQSGAGKTFIECQIATCLATGEDFFGLSVKERVGVMILAAKGESTLANHLEAARRERDAAQFLPIAWRGAIADLFSDQERAALLSQLRLVDEHFKSEFDVRLGCIFVDTMAQAFGFTDENSNAEASRALVKMQAISRDLGALVIPVHHFGKSSDSGLRGASAFRANADGAVVVLAEKNEATGKASSRSLAVLKSRDFAEGPIGDFELRFV